MRRIGGMGPPPTRIRISHASPPSHPTRSISLEELLDDYRDYLRARDLRIWDKESKEAQYIRRRGQRKPQTCELYREFVDTRPPEVIAKIAICLIHQANYLVDQQLRRLEKDFLANGRLRDRMTHARLQSRGRSP